jgi:hypothetical protein
MMNVVVRRAPPGARARPAVAASGGRRNPALAGAKARPAAVGGGRPNRRDPAPAECGPDPLLPADAPGCYSTAAGVCGAICRTLDTQSAALLPHSRGGDVAGAPPSSETSFLGADVFSLHRVSPRRGCYDKFVVSSDERAGCVLLDFHIVVVRSPGAPPLHPRFAANDRGMHVIEATGRYRLFWFQVLFDDAEEEGGCGVQARLSATKDTRGRQRLRFAFPVAGPGRGGGEGRSDAQQQQRGMAVVGRALEVIHTMLAILME